MNIALFGLVWRIIREHKNEIQGHEHNMFELESDISQASWKTLDFIQLSPLFAIAEKAIHIINMFEILVFDNAWMAYYRCIWLSI